jgi:hypothetical protein
MISRVPSATLIRIDSASKQAFIDGIGWNSTLLVGGVFAVTRTVTVTIIRITFIAFSSSHYRRFLRRVVGLSIGVDFHPL